MRTNNTTQLTLENIEAIPLTYGAVILNKEKFIEALSEVTTLNDLSSIKNRIFVLKDIITNHKKDQEGILNIDTNGDTVSLRRDVLTSELNQILESQTLERAKYYLNRLKESIQKVKTSKVNDINLLRWKEYDGIITDSLAKEIFPGTYLKPYFIWGQTLPKRFSRDTLAAVFIEGHTCRLFLGDRLWDTSFFRGHTCSQLLFRDTLTKEIFQGRTCSLIYSGTHLPKRFSGDTLEAIFYSGTYLDYFFY